MRTLVYAYREIYGVDEKTVKSWSNETFENNLTLIGATGFEDMLQD